MWRYLTISPPLIFELNQLFLKVFGHTENAIGYGSLLLMFTPVSCSFYLLLIQWFKNDVLAFFGYFSYFISIFYQYEYFGSGNYTEQYGVLCVTISTYFCLGMEKGARI